MSHVGDASAVLRSRAARVVLAALVAGTTIAILPSTAAAQQKGTPGLNNDITDVTGVLVGHVTNEEAHTGTTVVYVPDTATAGVDVRGGSAITRETDLLKPTNEVQKVNAILLTGGGEYGLAAGPGAMQYLYEQNQGFQVGFTPDQVVPILPGAAINDLRPGRDSSVRPGFQDGFDAAEAAASGLGPVAQGNIGAGAGAVAGGLKGGLGSASVEIAPGIIVAALVVIDSAGSPVDVARGCGLLAARYGVGTEFAGRAGPEGGCGTYRAPSVASGPGNTGSVLGIVATNINLDKAMNQKVAEVAHDGVTRALGASHGMGAGDTMFSISTDKVTPAVGVLPDCLHAAIRNTALGCQLLYQIFLNSVPEVVSRAIGHAMLEAESVPGLASSYCGTFAAACAGAGAAAASKVTPEAPAPAAVVASRNGGGTGRDIPWLPLTSVGSLCFATAYATGRRRATLLPAEPEPVAGQRSGRRSLRRVAVVTAAAGLATFVAPGLGAQGSAVLPDDPRCQQDAGCLATVDRIGEAMKRTMARAIVHAMVAAKDPTGGASYCTTFPEACDAGPGGYPKGAGRTGPFNNITDVPGVTIGSFTDDTGTLGTTVMHLPAGGTAGVEVRGSAPGGRGTDSTRADTAVQPVHALILTGGSAYGLEAADGVTPWLEKKGLGTPIGGGKVMPVVPTSVIFDLGRFGRPWTAHATAEYGAKAIAAAKVGPQLQGSVGGGAGASAGGLKGGLGFASEDLGDGVIVGAVVDVNAFGTAVDLGNACGLIGAAYQVGSEFGGLEPPPGGCGDYRGSPFNKSKAGENTTIGIVATNLPMSRALLSKMAQYGQDGLAAALRPSHTYFDGDTVWAVSTGAASAGAPVPAAPTTGAPVAAPARPRPAAGLPATGGRPLVAGVGLVLAASGFLLGRRRRAGDLLT